MKFIFNENLSDENVTDKKDASLELHWFFKDEELDKPDAFWDGIQGERLVTQEGLIVRDEAERLFDLEERFKRFREWRNYFEDGDILLVSLKKAAWWAGVSEDEVRSAIARSEIRKAPISLYPEKIMVRVEDLAEWMNRSRP